MNNSLTLVKKNDQFRELFFPFSIGFDDFFDRLSSSVSDNPSTFPPYNILRDDVSLDRDPSELSKVVQQIHYGTVLDLFCGIGNFSLPSALKAKNVIGIEGDASAIAQAEKNATLNNITNCSFHDYFLMILCFSIC